MNGLSDGGGGVWGTAVDGADDGADDDADDGAVAVAGGAGAGDDDEYKDADDEQVEGSRQTTHHRHTSSYGVLRVFLVSTFSSSWL